MKAGSRGALEDRREQGTGQHTFSPFTNILWARLEGSRGRKKSRKGEKCVVSRVGGQAHLNCSSLLGHLERQVFSFEVRGQAWQDLKQNPGL